MEVRKKMIELRKTDVKKPKQGKCSTAAVLAGVLVLLMIMMGFTLVSCGQDQSIETATASEVTGSDAAGAGQERGTAQGTGTKNGAGAETGPKTGSETDQQAPLCTLFFASDYQKADGFPDPQKTLRGILRTAAAKGKHPDQVIICGDYTNDSRLYNYQLSPEDSIRTIRKTVKKICPDLKKKDMVFVQGNHDRLTESIADSGLHEYEDCLIYVLNTEMDYPWVQGHTTGSLKKVTRAAKKMEKCFDQLIAGGETRPVFIAGHVPLHYTARTSSRHGSGDNLYAKRIFKRVNRAAKSLNIIYLYGHNHSKGWDCYMGGACVYKAAGDTLLLPDFTKSSRETDSYTKKILRFTYLNAGYLGYYMNCGPEENAAGIRHKFDAADMTLTGTICEIYPDRVVLTRYDSNGKHRLGARGEANPYRNYIDRDLIGEEYYARPVKSPQTVPLKSPSSR